jgi:hypothetical protein
MIVGAALVAAPSSTSHQISTGPLNDLFNLGSGVNEPAKQAGSKAPGERSPR